MTAEDMLVGGSLQAKSRPRTFFPLDDAPHDSYNRTIPFPVRKSVMRLLGYVSDERYVALADVAIEFSNHQGQSWEYRSRAFRCRLGELPDGDYTAILQKSGFVLNGFNSDPSTGSLTTSDCCPTDSSVTSGPSVCGAASSPNSACMR